MRKLLILLPILLGAAPAAAEPLKVPPQLTDPAMAEKLERSIDAVSKAMLDLRVGAVQAAIEGREATAAEKKLTVRDLGRRNDPNFDRNFHERMANVGPTIEQGMKALSEALPAMTKGLEDASKAIERAAANMPDPTYPKR